jgi:hypothetical protein
MARRNRGQPTSLLGGVPHFSDGLGIPSRPIQTAPICLICGRMVCACPFTDDEQERRVDWAIFSEVDRMQVPNCFTCGNPAVSLYNDGSPRFACSHVAKAGPR